eukprot:PLAT10451.1.p1 GENE.PLAT10451.1~~PLAT10451.1.p1  ORF type:complete len:280 (-),score=137.20 PLAT10451.1:227-1012(-)
MSDLALGAVGALALRKVVKMLRKKKKDTAGSGKTVAIILSGCGVYDGSEIHEAVSVMLHAQRVGATVSFFAPDVDQAQVIDHVTGSAILAWPLSKRSVLKESARIARGKICPLAELDVAQFDALLLPGGFGAAKNLCDFAFAASPGEAKLLPGVASVISDFHAAGKPIGFTCIAPVLAALALPGVSITVGKADESSGRWPYAGTVGAVGAVGAVHVEKDVDEVCVDKDNKIVTTPAYMCDATAWEVYTGIGKLVDEVMDLA